MESTRLGACLMELVLVYGVQQVRCLFYGASISVWGPPCQVLVCVKFDAELGSEMSFFKIWRIGNIKICQRVIQQRQISVVLNVM
jgi:hypothetical protein